MTQHPLPAMLSSGLEANIRDNNPWWRAEKMYSLAPMKRWAFPLVLNRLQSGLTPAVVLRGPRQIGKTTLLLQVIEHLLAEGVQAHRIFRLQFDELPDLRKIENVILELCRWFSINILQKSFNMAAHDGEQAYIFLDEVQNLPDWAPQLKHLVDMHPVKVLLTGSSAFAIEAGRDSLAGRITTLDMGPLLLREISELRGFGSFAPFLPPNGLGPLREKETWRALVEFGNKHRASRQNAFKAFSERGAYPAAQTNIDQPWETLAEFLVETVIKRVIQYDLKMSAKGRPDEHLLQEVFHIASRYIGQSPGQTLYVAEIKRAMKNDIPWQRILTYLKFLDSSLLLRLVKPLELRLRKRLGYAKLCLCDHALRAAWLQEMIPLDPEGLEKVPHLYDLAGRIAESTVGYFFSSITWLNVAHLPERGAEPEVDFVLTIGDQRIPVEVKYRRHIDHKDTKGLRAFIETNYYNAPFGILVTLTDEPGTDDPRIISMPLSTLLLLR